MRYSLIFILLAGCATIDTSRAPPPDWPLLKVEVVRTTSAVVEQKCKMSFVMKGLGCAMPIFPIGVCRIYLATDDPATLLHEHYHCKGFDHAGESTLRDAWARYKGAI